MTYDGQRPQEAVTYSPTDRVKLEKLNTTPVADTGYDSRDRAAPPQKTPPTARRRSCARTTATSRKPGGPAPARRSFSTMRITGSFPAVIPVPIPARATRRSPTAPLSGRASAHGQDRGGRAHRHQRFRPAGTAEVREGPQRRDVRVPLRRTSGRRTHVITPQGSETVTT